MTYYGLLASTRGGFSVSPLARQILKPLPGEEAELRRKAFYSVALYREILAEFESEGRLPDALPILLERRFGILHPAGDAVAKVFVESAQFAGIITVDRQIISEASPEKGDQSELDQDEDDESTATLSVPRSQAPTSFAGPVSLVADQISVSLTNPATQFFTQPTMTRRQKDRVLEFIDRVVKPWLEFQVEEEEGEAM